MIFAGGGVVGIVHVGVGVVVVLDREIGTGGWNSLFLLGRCVRAMFSWNALLHYSFSSLDCVLFPLVFHRRSFLVSFSW